MKKKIRSIFIASLAKPINQYIWFHRLPLSPVAVVLFRLLYLLISLVLNLKTMKIKKLYSAVLLLNPNLLKELQNCILYIINVWSLFYSVRVYKICIFYLYFFWVKLGFRLCVFWLFIFLYIWFLVFSFSVLSFEFIWIHFWIMF